jgi:peptidoglycan-associated lipoprotein
MKFKELTKIVLLSASVLSLAACSTTGRVHGGDVGAGAGNDLGAGGVTAGTVGTMSSFDGQGNANPMAVGNQSYYFGFNQSNVDSKDLPSIGVQAHYLNAHPNGHVLLEGNTDERGSREYNIALGQRRAQAVQSALEAAGVASNQTTTVSYGAEKPVALGHDESAWEKNRRSDLVYKDK